MLRMDLQHFGGRGASSGGGGGGASVQESNQTYTGANEQTQAQHKQAVNQLASDAYEDGTYDLNTMEQVSYDKGYQVTFSQIGDNYSDVEYAEKVNEFLAVSSDGKVLAGKFEGTPEVSFHCNSRATAVKLAKKYNQISVWDWKNQVEIKTGGTGEHGNN